jgi:hypothetical protein
MGKWFGGVEEPPPPVQTGRSQYLRAQLMELYEEEWARDKEKREKEREEELSAQKTPEVLLPEVPKKVPKRKRRSEPVVARTEDSEPGKLPPIEVAEDKAPEIEISAWVEAALKDLQYPTEAAARLRERLDKKRKKKREEEQMLVSLLSEGSLRVEGSSRRERKRSDEEHAVVLLLNQD